MTPWQLMRQLQYLLRADVWPGGTAGVGDTFPADSVIITAGVDQRWLNNVNFPVCLIKPGTASSDDDEPGLIRQDVQIQIAVKHEGDFAGEFALTGRNRPAADLKSIGRGLMEVEERIYATLAKLSDASGIRITGQIASATDGLMINSAYIAQRSYAFTCHCADTKFYHPPTNFAITIPVSNPVLTWDLPATRYDSRRVMIRRLTASFDPDAPPSATDGIEIDTDADDTTITDPVVTSPTTYTYSAFYVYDEHGEGSDQQYSDPGICVEVTTS